MVLADLKRDAALAFPQASAMAGIAQPPLLAATLALVRAVEHQASRDHRPHIDSGLGVGLVEAFKRTIASAQQPDGSTVILGRSSIPSGIGGERLRQSRDQHMLGAARVLHGVTL
jgi:hypothetical protein